MKEIRNKFLSLSFTVGWFQMGLYHQKHAFYFRGIKKWMASLSVSSMSVKSCKA